MNTEKLIAEEADVDQETLKSLLHYDQISGLFTWKDRPEKFFKSTGARSPKATSKTWNKKFSGKRAGCIYETRKNYPREVISIFNISYFSHRLAWLYVTGDFPKNEIDHINGQPADNRFCNLRDVSSHKNSTNLRMNKRNKSGVTGVLWDKKGGKWMASIAVNGKNIHLKYTDDFCEAVEARKEAELLYGFHPNHGTRPIKT